MDKKHIAIIGAGWLGTALAKHLLALGNAVTASRTGIDGVQALRNLEIPAVAATLDDPPIGDWAELLQGKEIAICLLPPNRGNAGGCSYPDQIQRLLALLKHYQIRHFIMISSTGVYQKANTMLTETSPVAPQSVLHQAEQHVLAESALSSTIIRFAGLIDSSRSPVRSLSKKAENGHIFDAGDTPINLIHRQDCIDIITQIIAQDCWSEILNACADCHPSRQTFYQQSADALGITVPTFRTENSRPKRVVSNDKLKSLLDYEFSKNTVTDLVT